MVNGSFRDCVLDVVLFGGHGGQLRSVRRRRMLQVTRVDNEEGYSMVYKVQKRIYSREFRLASQHTNHPDDGPIRAEAELMRAALFVLYETSADCQGWWGIA